MKVLLVNPRRSACTGESISAPHEGLLSLAATLRAETFFATKGTAVAVADDQLRYLEEPGAPSGASLPDTDLDIIGVQAVTATVKNAAALLWMARRRTPGVLTVMGGVDASMQRAHEYTVHETDPDHYSGHAPVASSPAASIDELRELFLDCHVRRRWQRIALKPTYEEVRRKLLEITSKRERPTLTSGEPALTSPAY
jgi:hypothetical protein